MREDGAQRAERGCGRLCWAGRGQSLLTPRKVPDPHRASGAPGCVWGPPSLYRLSCCCRLAPWDQAPSLGRPHLAMDRALTLDSHLQGPALDPASRRRAGPADPVSPEPLPLPEPGQLEGPPALGTARTPGPPCTPHPGRPPTSKTSVFSSRGLCWRGCPLLPGPARPAPGPRGLRPYKMAAHGERALCCAADRHCHSLPVLSSLPKSGRGVPFP